MGDMDGWNLALLAVAAYIAVVSLARLMARRRNELMQRFRDEVEKEKARRKRKAAQAPKAGKLARGKAAGGKAA